LKQWQCKEWYENKAGFITASKCKKVYTPQKTLEKHLNKNHDVSCLVNEIVHAKKVSHIHMQVNHEPCTQREWGLTHEDSAHNAYFRVERHKHHKIQLEPHGLLISNKKPFLGASLDNIRRSQCSDHCPPVIVEYKCPWKHRDLQPKEAFLTKEIGGVKVGEDFKLLQKSQYYFQVQLQMFVANIFLCDLVVRTNKGIFTCIKVKFNANFFEKVLEKLETFWKKYVLSYMIFQLLDGNKESLVEKLGKKN
jgi:hypothetical protein